MARMKSESAPEYRGKVQPLAALNFLGLRKNLWVKEEAQGPPGGEHGV